MDTQDIKNNILYSRIVKDVFGFTRESYKLFKHRLFFERDIAPEYKKLLGDSKDLRVRYDISNKFSEDAELSRIAKAGDKGWKIFNTIFQDASSNYRITYQDYYNNKVLIDSNEIKIPKLFKKYYTESTRRSKDFIQGFRSIYTSMDITDPIKKRILNCLLNNLELQQEYGEKVFVNFAIVSFDLRTEIFFKFKIIESENVEKEVEYSVIVNNEQLTNIVKDMVDIGNEAIGIYKAPRRNLQLVVSLNPVDWFLCSTSENWGSCLNLDSDGEVFWQGLPSLIGDKNRAMVYITDGSKKIFEGIKVDKIISRSWVLLLRSKEDNKTHFHFVREYPNSIGLRDMAESATGIDFKDIEFLESNYRRKKIVSRYYIETLFDHQRIFSTIYMDTTKVKVAKKNKAKYNFGEYCYYKLSGSGYGSFELKIDGKTINGVEYNSDMPRLRDLLDNGEEIQGYLI